MEEMVPLSVVPAQKGEFAWYDYLIFVVTLVVSVGIGFFYACSGDKNKTTNSYILANRSLGVIPVALSMFMSYISAILVIGNTAEMYTYGITQMMTPIGTTVAFMLSALFIVPLVYPLQLTSSCEYFEIRFQSKTVRLLGSFTNIATQVLYMGFAMYTPASALETVTPIPTWVSLVVMGLIGTIYTSIGGIKAVAWTDVFQGFILITGVLIALILGTDAAGGISQVWQRAGDTGRLDINWDPNPFVRMNVWTVVIPPMITFIELAGFYQTSLQRYSNMPTLRQAQVSTLLNIPLLALAYGITFLCGSTVFAYYDSIGCDILRTPLVSNPNQLLPYFIVNDLKIPGLPGIFIAVLFGGALSSTSSSLTSLSTLTLKDFLKPILKNVNDNRMAMIAKCLTVLYGCLGMAFAFAVENMPGHVMQASASIIGAFEGPLIGLFYVGFCFPCVNWIGATCGWVIAWVICMIVMIGNSFETPYVQYLDMTTSNCSALGYNATAMPDDPDGVFTLFKLSYQLISLLGIITCILVGLIVSFITTLTFRQPVQQEVSPKLVVFAYKGFICCIPKKFLLKLGVSDTPDLPVEISQQEGIDNSISDNLDNTLANEPQPKEGSNEEPGPDMTTTPLEIGVGSRLSDKKVMDLDRENSLHVTTLGNMNPTFVEDSAVITTTVVSTHL